jgi:hypothetical protein
MINPPNPLFKGGIKQDNYSPLEKEAGGIENNNCLFHLKSIPGFQFKSIPLLFNYQEQERKGVPLFSPVLVGALARCFIFFISSIIL